MGEKREKGGQSPSLSLFCGLSWGVVSLQSLPENSRMLVRGFLCYLLSLICCATSPIWSWILSCVASLLSHLPKLWICTSHMRVNSLVILPQALLSRRSKGCGHDPSLLHGFFSCLFSVCFVSRVNLYHAYYLFLHYIYIYIFCVCVSMFIGVEAWLEGDLNMSRRFTVMLIFRSLDSFGQVLSRKFRFRPIDQLTIDKCLDVCGFNRNPHGSFWFSCKVRNGMIKFIVRTPILAVSLKELNGT